MLENSNTTLTEIKCMEHPTLKVPYEVFNKRYRGVQKVLDLEARQTTNSATEITVALNGGCKAGEINVLLGGMVEKLKSMKRKATSAISDEIQAACICKKRLQHIKEHAAALADPNPSTTILNHWRKQRLDRLLVDYCLRNGYYDAANKIAHSTDTGDLTNIEIYQYAVVVERELREHRTQRSLQWCAENKSKLRKLSSNIEFKIRIQEFIELVREDKRLDAVTYARKYLSNCEKEQMPEVQQCMGMLAFPKDTKVEPYKSLLCLSRWDELISQFRWEHARLLHPSPIPVLPVALQLGLAALNTPQCHNENTKVAACPACQPPLNKLAKTMPHAHCSHSRLVCRISQRVLNENNHPMVLPNGQVYGEQALKEMMKENGAITCPKTNEVFCMKRVEKVYVM